MIDPTLRRQLRALLKHVATAIENFEGYIDSSLSPIETKDRPGFVATTNGGYDGCTTLSFNGSEESLACLRAYYDRDYAEMVECFSESLVEADAWLPEYEGLDAKELWELDGLDEARQEHELWWKDRADEAIDLNYRAIIYNADNRRNESGKDEIYFVGFVDFGACGDAAAEWSRTVPIADLTPAILRDVRDSLVTFFTNA